MEPVGGETFYEQLGFGKANYKGGLPYDEFRKPGPFAATAMGLTSYVGTGQSTWVVRTSKIKRKTQSQEYFQLHAAVHSDSPHELTSPRSFEDGMGNVFGFPVDLNESVFSK